MNFDKTHGLVRRKRATVLALIGGIFILSGVGISTANSSSQLSQLVYEAHLSLFPLPVWGGLFIVMGTTALVSSFFRHFHWIGCTALMAISSFWGFEFVISYLLNGYSRSLTGFLQWAQIVAVLAILVNWEDPPARNVQAKDLIP